MVFSMTEFCWKMKFIHFLIAKLLGHISPKCRYSIRKIYKGDAAFPQLEGARTVQSQLF